ncbi:MAG: 50S ribosomal protein L10 [Nanoarchaeota archaeon]|mgnify:CR=1 FL=1|nr:50S ribosomal protein L10 [Nanoarchaeota archaeon]|tara:strand:- start:4725 stop:5660 length:936 start_codon:yes stop_codon:yes gene_type:complete
MKEKKEPSKVKLKEVELLKGLISKYKTIGLLDINNLPSPQLQIARKKIDGEIRVTKKRLLRVVLKDMDKGLEKLEGCLDNIVPTLILTNDSSFKLAKFLRQNKSQVAAKPGQIAPKDLVVPAGPTALPPGPIIGELGAAGIKASVEGGKVTVKEDSVVVKEGEMIKDNVADILGKLGVKPMEIGLNLVATFEDGSLFKRNILEVDDGVYVDKLKGIANEAMNLTVSVGYITKDNVQLVLRKVQSEVLALDKIVNAGRDKLKKDLATGDKEGEALTKKLEENKPKKESKPEEKKESSEEKPEESKNNVQGGN